MPSLANSGLRLLRRILGAPARGPAPHEGTPVVLDGNTAVAETAIAVCGAAALGGSFPADGADLAWRTEQRRLGVNAFGDPLSTQAAEGPRGALASAMGLALSGVRATSFLSGPDLAACGDLLASAAGLRLPLVLHLSGRAIGGPGPSLGDGHEAIHLAGDTGCLVLTAANAQEAADFALIAHRTAEQALCPAVVAIDGAGTALALQDLRLPDPGLIADFIGGPDDRIPCPSETQRLLFGDTRRRLPQLHDPDRPVLWGALLPAEAVGPARAAGRAFLDPSVAETLEASFARFSELTGRAHRGVSAYRLEDAGLILVAMGSAVETAEAVADHLRARHRLRAGVIGIRRLSPFPGAELTRLLGAGVRVWVLECSDMPLAEDPPLLRALRAAVDRAEENSRFGADAHPGYPALGAEQRPRLHSAIYGIGGVPLRPSDLVSLCLDAKTRSESRVFLGIDFLPAASAYPKRQVLLDRLRRAYPEVHRLGLRSPAPSPDLRPPGALTLAMHRCTGAAGEGFAAEAAALLHRISRGGLRGRPALFTRRSGEVCVDRLTSGPPGLRDPGVDPPAELVLSLIDQKLPGFAPELGIREGGTLLVQSSLPDEALWARLPAAARSLLRRGGARLYRLPLPESPQDDNDYLLGAAFGLLLKDGRLDVTRRRLLGAREEMLRLSANDVERRLASFENGLDAPHPVETDRLPSGGVAPAAPPDEGAPSLVRRVGGGSGSLDSLPRFWDQVGVLYRTGDTAELAPDPYLALGGVPPLTSGFRDLSPLRTGLPVLDPALCTGCGACWSACPDGAIGAVALTPARLIDQGIRRAGADALRPLASKLAEGVSALCRDPLTRGTTAGELIEDAFRGLEARLPFPEERKVAVARALESVVAAIGCLPLAATEPFFSTPEATAKGSGALLALSLAPEACKDCGICLRVCDAGAWTHARQGSEALAKARRVRTVWNDLPDTDPAIISAARQDARVGALAAGLLGPGAATALAGGDGTEPGSGARLALRVALGLLHSRQEPRLAAFARDVETTRQRLSELIREILANALPADDLDALALRLESVDSRQADLGALIRETGGTTEGAVDAARLRRLVDLAHGLGDLAGRLTPGSHGLGRAPVGLVLSPGSPADWAAAFPDNPFSQPAILDWTGDGAPLAAGLLEGQLRQATRGFALMRRAHLELERPADAARLWSELDALTWQDLDDSELALCPTLLLVGDSGTVGGRGLAQLVRLLGGDLPARVLLFADLDLGLGGPSGLDLPPSPTPDAGTDLPLLTLSQRGAYIAQTCTAVPDHLAASLEGALGHPGPALLQVHAPSPSRHGFPADATLERARMAVEARVLPLFRYDPRADGVFGSRIDLGGNPAPGEPWSVLHDAPALTPADWALGERRFAHLFSPLSEEAPGPIPLAEYLDLADEDRPKHTPFVQRAGDHDGNERLRVDERLIRACRERQQAWRVLQELGGLVTPFTARVRKEAEERVAAEHQSQIRALEASHERNLQELRARYQEELRQDIRERLMVLAGYGKASSGAEQGPVQ